MYERRTEGEKRRKKNLSRDDSNLFLPHHTRPQHPGIVYTKCHANRRPNLCLKVYIIIKWINTLAHITANGIVCCCCCCCCRDPSHGRSNKVYFKIGENQKWFVYHPQFHMFGVDSLPNTPLTHTPTQTRTLFLSPQLPCSVCFAFLSYVFCVAWLLVFAPHQKQQENWFFCLSFFWPFVRLCFCTFNGIWTGVTMAMERQEHDDSTHPADDEMCFCVAAGVQCTRCIERSTTFHRIPNLKLCGQWCDHDANNIFTTATSLLGPREESVKHRRLYAEWEDDVESGNPVKRCRKSKCLSRINEILMDVKLRFSSFFIIHFSSDVVVVRAMLRCRSRRQLHRLCCTDKFHEFSTKTLWSSIHITCVNRTLNTTMACCLLLG